MVLSLAVARLLNGLSRFVQHPKKIPIYSLHLIWVFCVLFFVIHFWWWEFKLFTVEHWTFEGYLLIVAYATTFFLLCCLLFPDQMDEYGGFKDYFASRHGWFYGIFAITFLIDFWDTWMKGEAHFRSLGVEYVIRNCAFIGLSLLAIFIKNIRFQYGFAITALIYEVYWIFRQFHTQ